MRAVHFHLVPRGNVEKQVSDIRSSTDTIRNLAKQYNVCEYTISRALRGLYWKHVKTPCQYRQHVRLTSKQVCEVRLLYQKEQTNSSIAKQFNVSASNISRIVNKKRRKDVT